MRHFLSSYQNAACLRDAEGLTPLLRAAHYGFFMAVEIILKLCPESVDVYDPKGRTVLHYVHFAAFMILQDLFKIPEIDALKNVKDCEGNTPAHLAVFNGDLLLIKVLHESMADFSLKNNQNISAEELIESHEGFFGKMVSNLAISWLISSVYEISTSYLYIMFFLKIRRKQCLIPSLV